MPKTSTRARDTGGWSFRARFRSSAFGWRSSALAAQRVDEAVREILRVAKHDPQRAAEGAVLFLEKVSPAVRDVDSSSGSLGNAVYSAVRQMVPVIANARPGPGVREEWLERLFEALQEDDPPYLESLGDCWGELCASPALASIWVDKLIFVVRRIREERKKGTFGYFRGTSACFSALLAAGRLDELFALVDGETRPFWADVLWAGRALAAQGRPDEAIEYVLRRTDDHSSPVAVARFCEGLLLANERHVEAYERFALEANHANTHLARFRVIAAKYPEVPHDRILGDLVAASPGGEGKWFATAKSLGQLDFARALAIRSPCDPKTLTRATRDHVDKAPAFAADVGLAALRWMAAGHGYELTSLDVRDAWRWTLAAGANAGRGDEVRRHSLDIVQGDGAVPKWMRQCLMDLL